MDVFQRVQEIRKQRHRRTSTGRSSIFSGLVFCADCKSKMYFCSCKSFKPNQEFFDCSVHWKNKEKCSGHFIRAVVLLDGYILHELVKAIYVESPRRVDGKKEQHIHIEYNGIGFIPIYDLIEQETA